MNLALQVGVLPLGLQRVIVQVMQPLFIGIGGYLIVFFYEKPVMGFTALGFMSLYIIYVLNSFGKERTRIKVEANKEKELLFMQDNQNRKRNAVSYSGIDAMLNDVVNVDSDSGDSSIISSTTFSSSTTSSSSCSESESSLGTASISSDSVSISSVSTASSFNGRDEEDLAKDTLYGRDPTLLAEMKSIEQKLHDRHILSTVTQRPSNVESSTLKAISDRKDSILQLNLTSTYLQNAPEGTVLGKDKDYNSQPILTSTYLRNPNGSSTPSSNKLEHKEGISSFLDSRLENLR